MEPSHIPEINQQKAALVRAELLIQAHQRWLVQYIKGASLTRCDHPWSDH